MPDDYFYSSLTGEEIEARLLGAVRSDVAQNLNSTQQERARVNIGAMATFSQDRLIPSGGTTGQILKKTSSANYSVEWANENAGGVTSVDGKTGIVTILPTGGTTGQVLKKTSNSNYAVAWGDSGGGGGGGSGTSDYTDLSNKPQINSVTLSGNLSASDLGLGTYSKPSGGIPETDLSEDLQEALDAAESAYQKPSGGIPSSDLASGVQSALLPSVSSSDNGKVLSVSGGSWAAASPFAVHKASITLSNSWSGSGPYTKTVTISGATITSNTKVDVQPDATTIAQMITDGVQALYINNNGGTLTAYAIGAAPTASLTLQVTYYETV